MPRKKWEPFPCDYCDRMINTEDDFGGGDYGDKWLCRACWQENCGDGKSEIQVLKEEIAELKIRLDQMERCIKESP